MKKYDICLTGASSFSGSWFCKNLLDQGYSVVALVNSTESELITRRLANFENHKDVLICNTNAFIGMEIKYELLALHGTATFDYRSSNFDIDKAVNETVSTSHKILKRNKPKYIVHTGTFSEKNESVSDGDKKSFNRYSESKSIIWDQHRELAKDYNIQIYKYVMPNPFGPLENPKFTHYLINCWRDGKLPQIKYPGYIRDNVPIDLLSEHYVKFIDNIFRNDYENEFRIYPSLYIESVLSFAQRYAHEIGKRLNLTLQVDHQKNHIFEEPRLRVNSDLCTKIVENWSEENSWDIIAKEAQLKLNF